MNWFRLALPVSMYMVSSGLVGHCIRLQITDFHLHLWQTSSEMAATDTGETLGICNLRLRPNSPEETSKYCFTKESFIYFVY
jgi:hypothetical protein